MNLTLAIALLAAVLGPTVSVFTVRAMDRRSQANGERDQDVALARLEEKVDAIPEKMNGKILKALEKHQVLCPWGRERTNSGVEVPR